MKDDQEETLGPRPAAGGGASEAAAGLPDEGPWVLGHRGAPREAPENTLASLERALEHGLDGVEYDLQRCGSGDAVLLHDETLDRTTDVEGPVAAWTLRDLARVDAGGWFHRDFAGEPVPVLDEALALASPLPDRRPLHMIELKDPGLVAEVARCLAEHGGRVPVRVASFHRAAVLEARDRGLPSMLLAVAATEDDRRFCRDEGIAAHGVSAGGWRTPAGSEPWPCERWAWSVDDPEDLLEACRRPLFGFNTNEPERALAVRELVRLAPRDRGPYPLEVPALEVSPGALAGTRGEWCGRWQVRAAVRNPFEHAVTARVRLVPRGGAFDAHGLPFEARLAPGERAEAVFGLVGGSWSPGADPALAVELRWRARGGGSLVLDAPLRRVRTLALGEGPRRVSLLREREGDPAASMVVRRQGSWLVCSIESAGGLREPRAQAHLAGETRTGARGVRLPLRSELLGDLGPFGAGGRARGPEGIPFSCAVVGLDADGRRRVRRWSGGLPAGLGCGSPGRLVLRDRA